MKKETVEQKQLKKEMDFSKNQFSDLNETVVVDDGKKPYTRQ